MERLEASLEKGKLLCGLGSSALCVACFGLRFLHRIRKSNVYAIFVPKRSADALVHSPMRQIMIALYAQTVNILAVSLRIQKRAARCERAASALRARCADVLRTRCGRAAGALRTRCGRARAFTNAIQIEMTALLYTLLAVCVLHSLVSPSALRTRCRRAADAQRTRCGRAADAPRTRCGRARAFTNAIKL